MLRFLKNPPKITFPVNGCDIIINKTDHFYVVSMNLITNGNKLKCKIYCFKGSVLNKWDFFKIKKGVYRKYGQLPVILEGCFYCQTLCHICIVYCVINVIICK